MRNFLLILLLSALQLATRAQSVAINADSSLPDPSAILDIKSNAKGVLVPRMTQSQRNNIATPAPGLLIYQTDNTSGFYYYDGGAWNPIKGSGGNTGTGPSPWSQKDTTIYYKNGHVGIGTDSASEPLTIQTGELQRGFSHRGPKGQLLSSFFGDTFFEFATVDNSDLYLGAGGFPHVTINGKTGSVGVNTLHQKNILQIQEVDTTKFYNNHIAFGDGVHSAALDQHGDLYLYSSTNIRLWPGAGSNPGYVGIGEFKTLANRLQIGDVGGFNGNDIAFGGFGYQTGMAQTSTIMQMGSTTDMSFLPQYGTNNGNVGINVTKPANKLQIGNAVAFAGNDLAMGNGAQATAFNQYPNLFEVASYTDFAFLPRTGSGTYGRVGINTTTPRATLDVAGSANLDQSGLIYFKYDYDNGVNLTQAINFTSIPNVSIRADWNVVAFGFDAYSDLRIKDTIGKSDPANDLQTLRSIRITNYRMKDRAAFGNKPFKKVIAQQVEKVYPQLISKHAEFIPNVYQLTDKVTKTAGGYLLHFPRPHHLGDTARHLKAILSERSGMEAFNIVSVPSPAEVIIDAPAITTEKIFVYGEEVPDFRTVDYEGLTTLNVSATQELDKKLESLDQKVAQLEKALAAANAHIRALTHLVLHSQNKIKKYENASHRSRHHPYSHLL